LRRLGGLNSIFVKQGRQCRGARPGQAVNQKPPPEKVQPRLLDDCGVEGRWLAHGLTPA
jgi:hypothetical protein